MKNFDKLPYEFDLYFDIKSLEQLIRIINDDDLDGDEDKLFDLIDKYNIRLPKHIRRKRSPFPDVIWIDLNGNYITEAPNGDTTKYQKMVALRRWLTK